MLSRKKKTDGTDGLRQDRSEPSSDSDLEKRCEVPLSTQSLTILERRIAQIWMQAGEQIEPLIAQLQRDDRQHHRTPEHLVSIAMQMQKFDPPVGEERQKLRVIHGGESRETTVEKKSP